MGKVITMKRRNKKAARPRLVAELLAGQGPRAVKWFPIALIALPLAVFSAIFFAPIVSNGVDAEAAIPAALVQEKEEAYFPICSGRRRVTCVVDGDTIWYRREKIRIADIDAPEVSNPGCREEARLGQRATLRLQSLLNQGGFTLKVNPDGDAVDRYGRSLKIVTRNGGSLGQKLVDEGLAEEWGGSRINWCR